LQLAKTISARSSRPDLVAMRGAIDSLLKYLLRSICTHLAGESASGTLWLRDLGAEGCRLRCVLRDGTLLNRRQMRRLSVSGLQLLESELPSSGAPACSPGHGLHHWYSCNVGAFIAIPMKLNSRFMGCFVIWIKPADPQPTPEQIERVAVLADLALQTARASRPRRKSI
jgi:hypothetical protein